MRLRNVTGSREMIGASEYVVHDIEDMKGRWKERFGNDNSIHIEIGMGKGQFLLQLARNNPHINYLGIEKYSTVLLRAIEKREQEDGLDNLFFIRMDAENIESVFAEGEVDRIYLNFSDPWPKDRHARRRLTSMQFLNRYNNILNRHGKVEFKTDNKDLFMFSLEQAAEASWKVDCHTFDLHHDENLLKGNIMTEYEEKFSALGNPIYKLVASR